MKIHFGHRFWANTTPSNELPRDFCAGIGPLQLGVVLVYCFNNAGDMKKSGIRQVNTNGYQWRRKASGTK